MWAMAASSAVLALCLAVNVVPSLADYSWDQIINQKSLQSGDVSSPAFSSRWCRCQTQGFQASSASFVLLPPQADV